MSFPTHRTPARLSEGLVPCVEIFKRLRAFLNSRLADTTLHRYLLILLTLSLLFLAAPVKSVSGDTTGRFLFTPQSGMVHVWTLKAWVDSKELCEVYRQDEEQPTGEDIQAYCGLKIYDEWVSAAPCTSFIESGATSACTGSYLTYQGYFYRDYNTYEPAPKSESRYLMPNCTLGQWCSQKPLITFTGTEPMPGYEIKEVHVIMGGRQYDCNNGDTCELNLPLTTNQGVFAEYWVVSSFGDESEHQTAHIRNLYRGENGGQYLVDILSAENMPYNQLDYAALTWDIFPEYAHPNGILFTIPQSELDLATSHHLYILAGKLIFTGKVDASTCVQNGLLDNSNANTCGEEKTYQAGLDSQNQYDRQLVEAGSKYGIPPRVVKAIITQESQFWPEPGIQFEYGLGCLSEYGVDVMLNWDTEIFLNTCTKQYKEDECAAGYASMTDDERAMVRGLALRPVGTDQEIDLITRVIRANVTQVDQTIRGLVDQPLATVTTYEDLWDFTIANYHAGNNCIATGIKTLVDSEIPITFENYCALPTGCPTACLYVERVKNYAINGTTTE